MKKTSATEKSGAGGSLAVNILLIAVIALEIAAFGLLLSGLLSKGDSAGGFPALGVLSAAAVVTGIASLVLLLPGAAQNKDAAGGSKFPAANILLVSLIALEASVLGLILPGILRGKDAAGGAPVIYCAHDKYISVGDRSGVSARDATGAELPLEIDVSAVNAGIPGRYPVVYSATDGSGKNTSVRVYLNVSAATESGSGAVSSDAPASTPETSDTPPETDEPQTTDAPPVTEESITETSAPPDTDVPEPVNEFKEKLDGIGRNILESILTDEMTTREKAEAIFLYVNNRMKYVSTSDKSDWIKAAYDGYTRKKGDCFNYFALSKELLTLAGIPSIDLVRCGGESEHYWQLVNVGDGWYHFDACPHPRQCPFRCFLRTEAEVAEYSEKCTPWRLNYYVYDHSLIDVYVEGSPVETETTETSEETGASESGAAETSGRSDE